MFYYKIDSFTRFQAISSALKTREKVTKQNFRFYEIAVISVLVTDQLLPFQVMSKSSMPKVSMPSK